MQVGTSSHSPVSRGTDYAFISSRLDKIRTGAYPRLPLGFIAPAFRTISLSPVGDRCAPSFMCSQMSAKSSKSLRLPERRGYRRKWGTTASRIHLRLLISYFSVLSLRSGRSVPHPKYCWISSRTSGAVAVLADRQTRSTSQPTISVDRGEMETVKQPSPST